MSSSNRESGSADDFESAWRAIVDGYDPTGSESQLLDAASAEEPGFAAPGEDLDRALSSAELLRPDPLPAWTPAEDPDEQRFVPPVPPPLPPAPLPRRLAWIALLGGPAMLLLLTVLRWRPADLIIAALIVAFIGGFGYLVATMRDEPRDPWDDGSRV